MNGDGIKELLVLTSYGLYIFYPEMESVYQRLNHVLNLLEEIKLLESTKI